MRICFFNEISILGGGELWVLKACHRLSKLGHQVLVVCPWRSALQERCQAEGIDVWSSFRMEGLPFYEPLYQRLKKFEADVVYCTVIGGSCEAAMLETLVDRLNQGRTEGRAALILKTGLPPMAGLSPQHYGFGAGPAVPRLHVVSERTRDSFLAWQPDADPEFVRVMREGTDLGRFNGAGPSFEEARHALHISGQHPVITCLARLHTMKGQDNLLLALPDVLTKHPDVQVLFAGEGDQKDRLERMRDTLGLKDRVSFLGHVDRVPELLRASDIVCHPSLADGMPNSLVEAMAASVPVVASAVGGIPELVQHEETGLLVEPHDIKAIAGSLNRLLDSSELRRKYGGAGRTAVRRDYDFNANLDSLLGSFEQDLDHVAAAYSQTRESPVPASIRVLFLMNHLRTGGEETELRILARHLNRERFSMSVLSLEPVAEASPAVDELNRQNVLIDTTCHGLEAVEDKLRYIIDKIRRERIQVVVACQDTRFAYQLFQNLSPQECRLVEHGGIVAEASASPKDRTTRYIGVSQAIRDAAAADMSNPGDAEIIPSMVDCAEFAELDRQQLRKAYGFLPGTCVITFLGRLDPKKRVEDLMQAAARLLPMRDNTLFLVAGGADAFQPAYAQQLLEMCEPLTRTNRVVFLGHRTDTAQLLAASDVLVLPGVGEGMSHVINEAGAAGLAVVAADDGAACEQLDDGEAGRIIPPGSPDLLSETLRELVDDPILRVELGSRLRAKVAASYSTKVLIPRWQALLAGVAAGLPDAHTAHIAAYDRTLEFPFEIQIQTNTLCNASCIMCPYPEVSKEFDVGRMDEGLYQDILDQCAQEPGLRRIEPFLMNEPFTDSRMIDLITKAKQTVPHAMVTVTTNGAPLVPKVVDRLIHTGLNAIWFSFNGATRETYEEIMGISYDKVKSNIDYLLKVKPDSLQVFVNMIETGPMAPEIEENIRYWQSLGVQSGTSPLVNRAGNVKNFVELNYKPISEQPVRTCELPFYRMYILYNGDAVLCCMDWRRNVVLGNVKRDGLRGVWNGAEYKRLRRLHVLGRDSEIDLCGKCSYTLR